MIWAPQETIATLFDKGCSTIIEYLANIFAEGELDKIWYVQICTYHLRYGF